MEKRNLFVSGKAVVAAVCGAFTAAFGWLGWLVVAWAACMALDWVSGSAAAASRGAWSSAAARAGIWHKAGMVVVVLVCALTDAVLAVAVALARRLIRHPLGVAAGMLIIAGGLGNLIDRVRLGYVVDMFHLEFWPSYPVFNVADICVVCGAVLAVIYYLWFYEKYDKRGKAHGDADAPSES